MPERVPSARSHGLHLQGAVDRVVSDALSIAMLLGTGLGVVMYAAAPWVLERIAGPASAAVVGPALVYVRIRRATATACVFATRQREGMHPIAP